MPEGVESESAERAVQAGSAFPRALARLREVLAPLGALSPYRGSSLARRLLILVAATVLPCLMLGAGTLLAQYRIERTQLETRLVDDALTLAELVDRAVERAEAVMRVLARSAALQSGDLGGFAAEMRAAREVLDEGAVLGEAPASLVLTDDRGTIVLDAQGTMGDFIGEDFAPARAALDANLPQVSGLLSDVVSGIRFIGIAVPVPAAEDASAPLRPVGAVGLMLPRTYLLDIVAKAGLPLGEIASVQDRAGLTLVRSMQDAETLGKLPAPGVLHAILAARAGLVPRSTVTRDGVPPMIAFARASRSGFVVTLEVPTRMFLAPLLSSLCKTAGIGLAIISAALCLALLVARRMVLAFRRVLVSATDAAASGERPATIGLREADELAAAFAATLRARDMASLELQRSTAATRSLLENSPIGIAIFDRHGRVRQASDVLLAILGRGRAEFEAGEIPWDEITPEEWRASDAAACGDAIAHGRCAPHEKEYQRPDGSRVPVLVSFGLIDGDTGATATFVVDLSDRKAALDALRESEFFASSILDATSDCVVALDLEGHITFINGPGRVQVEIDDAAQIIGRAADSLWPEDAVPAIRSALAEARAGQVARRTAFAPTAKGTPKWWDVVVSPLPAPDGTTRRLLSIARDVTERKRAEQALTRNADRQALLLEISQAMLASDRDDAAITALVFERVGPHVGADLHFRYRLDEHGALRLVAAPDLPEDLLELLDPLPVTGSVSGSVAATRTSVYADAAQIAVDPRAVIGQRMGLRSVVAHPLLGSDGRLLGTLSFASTGRDRFDAEEIDFLQTVSRFVALSAQRTLSERALRESEARLRAITDALPNIVWSAHPDGRTDFLNQRWYELTGAPSDQPADDDWTSPIHPDDRDRALAAWRRSLASGEPLEIEYRMRAADGTPRWMLGRALPVRDEQGRIVRWFGSCTDIEQIRQAREVLARDRADLEQLVHERTRDLEETQTRLAHSMRMESLGQLAGGIAHDFNNVLQAIQGSADLIERRAADPESVGRLSRIILDAADRGAAITRRLLTFSRRGELRTEPIDAEGLLRGMREMLAYTLGTGIAVRAEVPSNLPLLLADKAQLETVLVNLATNARDAMPGGGTLRMTATLDVRARDGVPGQALTLKAGGYVRLAISDTGNGMDRGTLARVTEPFFTTKPQGHGTGLGLSMAHGFAEQSGGALRIESIPGRGTTVSLWFPVAEGTLERAGSAEPMQVLHHDTLARLLIVDDNATVRELVAEQMEDIGYEILAAESGIAALAYLDADERIDLVVSDLSMPGMDGLTLLREAKRRRPELPAILLTGNATNLAELAADSMIGGEFSLLHKPIQARQLAECVAILLSGAVKDTAGR